MQSNQAPDMKQFRLLAVLIVTSLASCSSTEQRPDDWPAAETAKAENCPDISGTYTNDGRLFDQLTSEGAWGRNDCQGCLVDISWLDDEQKKLSVMISDYRDTERGPTIITETLTESDGHYRCENSKLIVQFSAVVENVLVGVTEFGEAYFEKGDDGSLLLERRFDVFAHFLALPMFREDGDYYRWPPFSKELATIEDLPAEQAISVVRSNVGKGRDVGRLTDKEFSTYRLQDSLDFADATLHYGDVFEACNKLTEGWLLLNGEDPEIGGADRQTISEQIDGLTTSLECDSASE
jgi:hypothetical protein